MKQDIIKEFFGKPMATLTDHEKMISEKFDARNKGNKLVYCQHDHVPCETCSLVNYGLDCHNNPI